MGEQQGFEFCRGDLKAFDFDQFFLPVSDEQIPIRAKIRDVAGA